METTIDNSFSYFLNGYNPSTNALVKQALEDMQDKSRLLPETLELAGVRIFSGNTDTIKNRLGFESIKGHPVLKISKLIEFPYYDKNSKILFYEFKLLPAIEDKKYLHPLNVPAYPYILPPVWDIADKPHKPLWITEGAKKVLKLIQHGRPCIGISGVYNFKAGKGSKETESLSLWRELEAFNWKGRIAYIGFDSDLCTNPNVRTALFTLACTLIARGAAVKIPTWKGEKGIDDFLASQKDPERALTDLEAKAKTLEQFVCFEHRSEIIKALSKTHTSMDGITREGLITAIAKKLNLKPRRLYLELENLKDIPVKVVSEADKETALLLLKDPDIMTRFIDFCHKRYIGRDKTLKLIKLATITRHFKRGLSVVLSGTSSVGKSELIKTVLPTINPSAVENFTRTSAYYLMYREGDLSHRIITYYELSGTSHTAEIIRTALSEGELKLGTVMKDAAGSLQAKEIEKDTQGLVILSTFTGYRLDHELSTRVLQQELSHNEDLAKKVYDMKAKDRTEDNSHVIWQIADSLIEPKSVVIPYIKAIAGLFPTREERYLRDFDKVVLLVKASALLHQYQREQTEDNTVIANKQDYELVYSLADAFTQSTLPVSQPVLKMLTTAQGIKDPTRADVQEILNVSESTMKRYISQAEDASFIKVEGRGNKQKLTVLEIPEPVTVLPSPEEVFKNITLLSDERLNDAQDTVDGSHFKPSKPHLNDIERLTDNDRLTDTMTQNRSNRSEPFKRQKTMNPVDSQGSIPIVQIVHEKNSENILDDDFVPEEEDIPEIEGERWEF